MKPFLFFAMLLLSGVVLAQTAPNYSYEYGRPTHYELTMTQYVLDDDAEAVVIYEQGQNHFERDDTRGWFLLYLERTIKIKILKQAGVKYGEFVIPYFSSDDGIEEIYGLEGFTYNLEDGQRKVSALNLKNVFDEKLSASTKLKKFAMPDVREGSVIEIKYTIITPFHFNMREWEFQKKIPVVYSKLEYKAIPYYEYTYLLVGANKFTESKQEVNNHEIQYGQLRYKEVIFTFVMKNLPAFKDEEFITSERDYMIRLNFQIVKIYNPRGGVQEIMSTWPKIRADLLKDADFGKYITAAEKAGKQILNDFHNASSQKEQLKDIVQYVKRNYNWDGFATKYATGKVSDFMRKKTGSSADINLFLVGMLRAAGIEAYPVALSTRKNGLLRPQYPLVQSLNYVIVQAVVNDTTYLFDGTAAMLVFNELPERCINVPGLVMKPKSEEWIDIVQTDFAFTEKVFDIKINNTLDMLESKASITAYNYDAYNYRSVYQGKEENLVKWLQTKGIELKGEVKTENMYEMEKPFIFTYTSETSIEQADDKLFIAPFLNQSVTENIFKQSRRKLPVDLIYLHAASYKSTIEIPKGYKVNYLPQAMEYDGRLMSINYAITQTDDELNVEASYAFKQVIYEAASYISLKNLFAEMVEKFNDMIVLVKDSAN